MTESVDTPVVALPKWFLGLLSFLAVGVVPWAWSMSMDVATIKTQITNVATQTTKDLDDLRQDVRENSQRIRVLEMNLPKTP